MSIYRTNNPTEFDDVDQIVIDETAPPPRIQGVSTNVGVLLGQFERGLEEVVEISTLKQLRESFGNDNSFAGNKSLKNKKFGRLKIRRVVASDAVAASETFQGASTDRITFSALSKGAYGNNLQVKIEDASLDVHEVTSITCVADVSDSLDGKTFILQDKDGSVAFWIDTDDSGTTIPVAASAADRAVEITTIVTDDAANDVATKVAVAINADSQFSAPAPTAAIVLATDAESGNRAAADASTSGFTLAESVAGVEAGKKYTLRDNNSTSEIADEVYDNLAIADITASTFAGSLIASAVVDSSAGEPDNTSGFVSLASGAEGTIADTDYESAINAIESDKANIVWLDAYNEVRRGYLKLHAANTQDRMCLGSGLEADTVAESVSNVASFRDTDGRLVYCYPWLETTIDGAAEFTEPASWMASILSQTSPHIDPAYSENAKYLVGVNKLKLPISRNEYIQLKEAGIAAFEFDEDIGFKVKSGVTTQIANSSKTQILRRRMADYLTSSAGSFLKVYQNSPNTVGNRTDIAGAILGFAAQQEFLGILPKDSEVPSGKAKLVDAQTLNTAESIGQGFTYILWKQRIFSSMRFIVLKAEIGETVSVTESD